MFQILTVPDMGFAPQCVDRSLVAFMLVSFCASPRRDRYDLHMNALRSDGFRRNCHVIDQFLFAFGCFSGLNDPALWFLRFNHLMLLSMAPRCR
jgi:hypothetical protein